MTRMVVPWVSESPFHSRPFADVFNMNEIDINFIKYASEAIADFMKKRHPAILIDVAIPTGFGNKDPSLDAILESVNTPEFGKTGFLLTKAIRALSS